MARKSKPDPNAHVLVITGDFNMNYQIIDSVFCKISRSLGNRIVTETI